MNLWHQFLWVIFPYLSLVTFVLGHIFRYRYDQYGWTPKSSQLLERRLLMWGVLLFHWGFLFVFGGHVMGLLVPIGVYHAIGVSDHNYHLLSLWAGAPVGIVAMIGILLLNVRRWFIPRIRNNTDTIRFLTDALLLVVILLGLAATIGYRVCASQYELHGEFEYRDNVGAWFRSLFLFKPDASLMVGAPLIFQLQTLSAFVLFALWPFSSLVHVFSVPLGYLRRSNVQYRSSNPQATLARERASKLAKKPAKAELLFVVAAALIISAIVVATAGLFLVEGGVALPALTLGFAGGALLASLALLALNLLGGFIGGKLGEWEIGPVNTSGGPDSLRGRTR